MPGALDFNVVDVVVFVGFLAAVMSISLYASRKERTSEGYFLAGRGLTWWLIGFSLIAANISTEQFVGMSGQAADFGMAIASYEWMAAVTLVVVAFWFLPTFLRTGIFTMPEFLEHRFDVGARAAMSLFMMIIYVGVTIAAVIYSGACTVDVLFTGKKVFSVIPVNLWTASFFIGALAGLYVAFGGLKACAWADLLQGSALIAGGAIIVVLAMQALDAADPVAIGLTSDMAQAGPLEKFWRANHENLHMVLPKDHPYVPWTALVLGLWIPNFYYWGLNQYITQRTLGSKSLSEGQKGVVFAAGMKLIIPFIIVVPGIIAFNLYRDDMAKEASEKQNPATLAIFEKARANPATTGVAFEFDENFATLHPAQASAMYQFNVGVVGRTRLQEMTGDDIFIFKQEVFDANQDIIERIKAGRLTAASGGAIEVQKKLIGYHFDSAFALLIKRLTPVGLRGFILAAILGAVMSSLASMLNAASTIFTMDFYKEHFRRGASQGELVALGRICVVVFTVIGCLIAPLLGHPKFGGIFTYIQEFQGFISPGVLAVFLFGLFVRRAPRACGLVGLLLSPATYGVLMLVWPELAFLNRMAVTFFVILGVLTAMTLARPLREPITLPSQTTIEMTGSRAAKLGGVLVLIVTAALYVIFW
ncbi:MAG: sodium/solute symporter [Pirellulales bacterium]|nr:sodium/solute symporter [Pirellulales bacterium]